MLLKCSSALLLTDVKNFGLLYSDLAEELGVSLKVEAEWNKRYRITEEIVICGSKFLDRVNEQFYPGTTVILKSGESPLPYVKKGIESFIYDYENQYELAMAFYKKSKINIRQDSEDMRTILDSSMTVSFNEKEYSFDFSRDEFLYSGKRIYLTSSEKLYLAEWLLLHKKDNSKRMCLFNMRKKFGNAFMKDIDRFGNVKENARA